MRLNRFNTNSINVRGGGGGSRFPGGGGGKVGCGTIVIAIIAALVFGVDPMQTIGAIGGQEQGQQIERQAGAQTEEELCTSNQYALETCNALGSLNETWQPVFQRAGVTFRQPTLTFMAGRMRTGCGAASSAMGPFYCPADEGIYIDTRFYDTMKQQLGAGGDFARYYVVAHEYGHHIQKLTGVAAQIRSLQQQRPQASNQLQVLMELQADCYAGVWAGKNRNLIEPGDMEEGLRAAASIGDDTLQRNAGQRVNPESFTHGTSQQRMQALKLGLDSADDTQCDRIVELR
ncbi:neutral zinc metallopeptidase [Pontixanthobacter aestiaquae]|uniref:Zinc metalloprotease n=1 Tax=Pontixanthobacter aestiaquae TaxID=1509367 RepID=A0A844ZA82_9SPHN|nr:neutral zinc metallopeptidase [Pontixanthobacter aestiaquae]MDN3645228.1 neutral zinc metallopeptidase [Pontixanthobacter aestiaquae]MXO83770.1 zinc metalloprotease [Pontixanthobacter aestiaquae]